LELVGGGGAAAQVISTSEPHRLKLRAGDTHGRGMAEEGFVRILILLVSGQYRRNYRMEEFQGQRTSRCGRRDVWLRMLPSFEQLFCLGQDCLRSSLISANGQV